MKTAWIAGCWMAAGLASGYQAPAVNAPAQPKGMIEGVVVNLATGAPLRKATVRLVGLGTSSGRGRGDESDQGGMPNMVNKETDEAGHFAVTGLEAGRYQLSVERQGFLRQNYGARRYGAAGTPLPLARDQEVKGLVFKLAPQSVIAGKVVDEDGEPMAGVQVRALRMAYRSGKKQWAQAGAGSTSDIGEYRIPNLTPGRYLVSALPRRTARNMPLTPSSEPLPATPETIYASTYYPNGLDTGTAAPVDVAPAAEVRGIDIKMLRTSAFRIRGKVAGAAAGGRGQVTVMLTPREDATAGRGMNMNLAMARPADGLFEIRGVAPGSYVLHAQLGNGPQQMVGVQPVEVGAQHVDGVVLTLAGGSEVAGAVKVADAASPVDLPNLSVNLRPAGMAIGGPPRSKVDGERKFVLKNVLPLRYTVSVSGVPESCYVQSIRYGGQEVPDAGIDMTGPAALEITLSARAAEVDAAVVDQDGKPVAGAIVALLAGDGSATRANSADENGAATFKGLKPGEYRLFAWEDIEPGAYQDPEFVKPFETRAQTVKLDPAARKAVQVKAISAEETAGKPSGQ